MLELDTNKIVDMYDAGESVGSISKAFNTYPNKIRRILLKSGRTLRNKSEAQALALQSGRSKHPTEGIGHREDVKERISNKVYMNWKNMSAENRARMSEMAKEKWNNMSEQEKDDFRKAAAEGVRKASREGSQAELYLLEQLKQAGHIIDFHRKKLIVNTDLELDFYLPQYNLVIEIDGPAHFFPIWGEESLRRNIKSDTQKNGLLLASGVKILRIKLLVSQLTERRKRLIKKTVFDAIQNIDKLTGLVELEVT